MATSAEVEHFSDLSVAGAGDSEPLEVSVSVPCVEWKDDDTCFVGDVSVTLSTATALLKLRVVYPKRASAIFEGVFDKTKLVTCNFNTSIALQNIGKIIRRALVGSELISAQIVDDGHSDTLKLKLTQKLFGFEENYFLPLTRKQLVESGTLKAALEAMRTDTKAKDKLIALLRKTIEDSEERATTNALRLSEIEKKYKVLAVEMAALKAEMEAERRGSAELIAELEKRDLIAAESKEADTAKSSLSLASATDTGEQLTEETATSFRFDTGLTKGGTQPALFDVSSDCKTATRNKKEEFKWKQIALEPEIHSGTHTVQFRIEESGASIGVGLVEDVSLPLHCGCAFYGFGMLRVNGSTVAKHLCFKGWSKGAHIKLTADLDNGQVTIEAPNGKYSAQWKPTSTPVRFAVNSSAHSLSIV